MKRRSTWLIVGGVAVIVCALLAMSLPYLSNKASSSKYSNDASVVDGLRALDVDWDGLRAQNPDTVGWIYIEDTPVNYPILWNADREKYLHERFDGEESIVGSIFIEGDNSPDITDDITFIYGHHLLDGSMFTSIASYTDQTFFDEHQNIVLATPKVEYRLSPLAAVVVSGTEDELIVCKFKDTSEKTSYLEQISSRASASSGESLSDYPGKLVCFVTCSYQTNDSRTLLFCSIA